MSSKKHRAEQVKLARTYHVGKSDTDSAIFDFFSALDTPVSLACWLLFKNKETLQLVNKDIDPLHYNDAVSFRDDYSAVSFLAKADFLPLDVSKKDAAFAKFFKYEELCRHTNNRFRNLSLDPNYHGPNVWLLNATMRKIEGILGDFSADEIVDQANWGPGVTTLLKGEHVSAVNKFHSENGITRDLYSLVEPLFKEAYPLWSKHLESNFGDECFNFQVGNSIVTVPKNSKTDRVIAVEPGINLWFQKGIGKAISRRLNRRGIDLQDQTSNQRLAKLGSITGHLATVDFSSASDSISKEVVEALLPRRWFLLMNACRTPLGRHNNTLIRWEKFSSMGNGFTFELESLIFFAAALAVCDYSNVSSEEVSVYGDDVIIPVACYDLFAKFSEFLGFTVNPEKSFSSSGFRESCGSHYFLGTNCKPIFLKERLSNVQSIYKLANSIRTLAHRRNSYCGCDSKFRNSWIHLFKRVPKPLRYGISLNYGDSGFVVNFDEACPSVARDGFEGSYTSALIEVGVTQQFDLDGLLLARLRSAGSSSSSLRVARRPNQYLVTGPSSDLSYGNNYTLRGRTRLTVSRLLIPQWYNLGPWK